MTGYEFRQARLSAGLTQQQLAERWGCHRDTIIGIEKRQLVRAMHADAISRILLEREHGVA